jgi:signal transduction histidine kinase
VQEHISHEGIRPFPKLASYIAFCSAISIVIFLTASLFSSNREHQKIHDSVIPALEMAAVNIELNKDLFNKLFVIFNVSPQERGVHIEEFRHTQESLHNNLTKFNQKATLLLGESKISLSRKNLDFVENRIIRFIQKGNFENAQQMYKDKEFRERYFAFNDASTQFIESLAKSREESIRKRNYVIWGLFVAAILAVSFLVFIWGRISNVFHSNIEERIQIEKDLTEQKEAALKTQKLVTMGEMAAGIGHEINNPLTIIKGFASAIKIKIATNKTNENEIVEIMTKIDSTADRVFAIVRTIKNLSRDCENDDYDILDFNEVIQDTLIITKEKLAKNSIDLVIDDIQPQSFHVLGRLSELSQVLINLVNNAADAIAEHNPEEKQIHISLNISNPEQLILKVSNTGPVIPEEIRGKIFNTFYTTKEVGKGTGLGLSLSKKIINNHQGELFLEAPMKQTTFVIKLPIIKEDKSQIA